MKRAALLLVGLLLAAPIYRRWASLWLGRRVSRRETAALILLLVVLHDQR